MVMDDKSSLVKLPEANPTLRRAEDTRVDPPLPRDDTDGVSRNALMNTPRGVTVVAPVENTCW